MAIKGETFKNPIYSGPFKSISSRSLRICLNLFSYYAPQIKEKHIKWYALRLLQCMSNISQRRETLLQETLCEFVKNFGRYLQQGLTDAEAVKLFEVSVPRSPIRMLFFVEFTFLFVLADICG